MSITYVSGFFDIKRRTEEPMQKFENYFQWIEQLLEKNIFLYFFTSQDLYEKLHFKPRPNLVFKILDSSLPDPLQGSEGFPFSEHICDIQKFWGEMYSTNNPSKDTAEFAALCMSKFSMILMAMEANPFDTEHYGWIDAGLFKIAEQLDLLDTVKGYLKIRLMLINYISQNEVQEMDFVKSCKYKIAGGFFTGPKALLGDFARKILKRAIEDLDDKKFGLEQEYMAIIYRENIEIFDPYYGDFKDLLVNYSRCNESFNLIYYNFQQTLIYKDEGERRRVGEYLLTYPYISEEHRDYILLYI